MCFSAEVSLGVAAALLPVGGYCASTAVRKNRAYLLFGVIPTMFGAQQFCEAGVWLGLERGDAVLVRTASLWFLFFALALWPAWIPLAAAVVEPRGVKRWVFLAGVGLGVALGCVYYAPLAVGGIDWANARVVGHSIRYDFAIIPAVRAAPDWVWPTLYLVAVCGPLLASADRRLRPLGVGVVFSAAVAYLAFRETFASVWCFLGAALSVCIGYVIYRLPDRGADNCETRPAPSPL